MNPYEQFRWQMRKDGRYYNPPTIITGVYKDGIIEADGHRLDKEDCLYNSSLIFDEEEYWTHTTNNEESSLKRYDRNIVRNGDTLALWKHEDKGKYLVLAKVVGL